MWYSGLLTTIYFHLISGDLELPRNAQGLLLRINELDAQLGDLPLKPHVDVFQKHG